MSKSVYERWTFLGAQLTGKSSLRTFRAHFCIHPVACEMAWTAVRPHAPRGFGALQLLWTLYFLKCNPSSWNTGAALVKVDPKTFSKWVRLGINLIASALPSVRHGLIVTE